MTPLGAGGVTEMTRFGRITTESLPHRDRDPGSRTTLVSDVSRQENSDDGKTSTDQQLPPFDIAKCFSAIARQRELERLQQTLGADFAIEFVAVDVTDEQSVATLADQFAEARVNGSAEDGRRFALEVAENTMIVGADMAPVAALTATGVYRDSGTPRRFGLLAFNARNNHVLESAFGELRRCFGDHPLREIERMALLHEAAHCVVQHAEQSGADAWSRAVGVLDEPSGKAGDEIRRWAKSDEGSMAYPRVRDLLLLEAAALDRLQERVRMGEEGLRYDADALRDAYQEQQAGPDYRNYQEQVSDAFMALTLQQEGVDVAATLAAARARGDREHNTQATLMAIADLPRATLLGMSRRQLMTFSAAVVRQALQIESPAGSSNNPLDQEGVAKRIPAPRRHGNQSGRSSP